MDVQHKHGDDNRQGDKDHGEEEVLANQGDDQRGGGDGLCDDEEEDS